jgi:hypothetical protein
MKSNHETAASTFEKRIETLEKRLDEIQKLKGAPGPRGGQSAASYYLTGVVTRC